jgi:two-component system OmpR family sensor kinase
MSLRRRLILAVVAVAIVLVVSGFIVANRVHTVLIDGVDQQLQNGGRGFPVGGSPDEQRFLDRLFFQIDADGKALPIAYNGTTPIYGFGPPALQDHLPDLPTLKTKLKSVTSARPLVTTISSKDGAIDYRVRVTLDQRTLGSYDVSGLSLQGTENTYDDVVLVEIISGLAILLTLGLISVWVLRQGLRPLRDIADVADSIAAGDLSHRVASAQEKTEAGRVGVAINRMLTQIEEDFALKAASERRLKQFVADASHELRTPLTSVRGYAELYQSGGLRSDAELGDAMRRVSDETARMGRLVDQLLMLARLDEPNAPRRAPVDIASLARDAVTDAHVVEPDRPIELDAPAPVVAIADEDLFRQVLANLMANVRLHTPAAAAVHVIVRADGNDAVLTVRDEGPGMGADMADHAFERFARADKARTRATGGTGLGLAIVQATAVAHGGTATLTSAPGEGTAVEVRIPLRPETGDTPAPDAGSTEVVGAAETAGAAPGEALPAADQRVADEPVDAANVSEPVPE